MTKLSYDNLLQMLEEPVRDAGALIMDVHKRGVVAQEKADGSPVTEADRLANTLLVDALESLAPDIPVVSEEDTKSHDQSALSRFFLVDPLDGTKEFLRQDGRGQFTVNIALIEDGVPVFGLVYAPAHERMFTGLVGTGAFENGTRIKSRGHPAGGAVAVASRSHRDEATDAWLRDHAISNTVSAGSSLKFGLVASGEADLYPRFGPTMEWDIAAGHAVLMAAGGFVKNPDGTEFVYGKPGFRNGPFIAGGDPSAGLV